MIMNILGKYFRRQLLGIFIMLLMILTGLSWMMQIMTMMKFLLTYGIEFSSFLYMTSLMVPFIMSIVIPFVTFIAVIFVYNKMISENEITVMAASYGLAHLKLQEAAFTKLADGLVVYVDNVSGYDLNQVMLSDMREKTNQVMIFAQHGKLISTSHGLSIVTDNGSLQMNGRNGFTTGTFDNLDMDLNLVESDSDLSFRVRRIPTLALLQNVFIQDNQRQHMLTLVEICTRFISPFMNLILAIVCTLILLKSSLLRRRASFAPAVAVLAMAGIMAAYMSASNMVSTLTDIVLVVLGVFLILFILMGLLLKK